MICPNAMNDGFAQKGDNQLLWYSFRGHTLYGIENFLMEFYSKNLIEQYTTYLYEEKSFENDIGGSFETYY